MLETMTIPANVLEAQSGSHGPVHFPWKSFAEFFYVHVHHPSLHDQPVLTFYDDDEGIHRTYTYGEFEQCVNQIVVLLHREWGIGRGDRIVTLLSNHDQTVMVYFAAWVLGAVVVPINLNETETNIQYIASHVGAKLVICWKKDFGNIKCLLSELPFSPSLLPLQKTFHSMADFPLGTYLNSIQRGGSLTDEALIVYTSGTTGTPKGVILTVYNLLVDAHGIATWHKFQRGDCLMCVLPIHHVNGIVVTLLTPFSFEGRIVLNATLKTSSFWQRVHDEQVTCVSVVPTVLEFLLEKPWDLRALPLDHFRGVICGAGPLFKETAGRFEDCFHFPIRHGYGLSETTCYSCFLPNNLSKEERRHWLMDFDYPSIGVPIPQNDMAILDDQGHQLSEREVGEICIRGQTICSGYLKQPEVNEAAFQWGWFRSGDAGFFVRDSLGRPFFFVSGRLKEIMIRGGVNISPLEIDEVLASHPSIKFAMTIPFKNRYYGEEIAGYVVPRNEDARPPEAEILAFCRKQLPFHKCPKVIVYGSAVPYTTTGKPKRLELKGQLRETLAHYRDVQFKEGKHGTHKA